MTVPADLADAAHFYAEHLSWHVHPLRPGRKEPVIPSAHPEGDPLRGVCTGECGQLGHGFHDATDDIEVIDQWWRQYPNANIGVALAASGLAVIDIDPRNGGDFGELDRAVDLGSPLAQTTGGGGIHLIYGDRGVKLRSSLTHIGLEGIDVKAGSGYIVVAPSTTTGPYGWGDDDEMDVEPMPSMVLDTLRAPSRPERSVELVVGALDARQSADIDAAVAGVCERLAEAAEGTRHSAVYYSARCLGEYVGGGVLDRDRAQRELTAAAEKLYGEALWRVEVKTIEGGLAKGIAEPRGIPDEHERARQLLERVATSEMPNDVLDLYYANNPEVLRACRHPALVDERQRAVGHVLDLSGPASADRCIMQLTHA